jgi:two-component system nitrogen regulation sensor histidine kinase NtrY
VRRLIPREGARTLAAPAAAGAALLLASAWLAAPGVGYLLWCLLATATTAVALRWTLPAVRTPLGVTTIALAGLLLMAGRATVRLMRFERQPISVARERAAEQRALLDGAVADELALLRRVAHDGLAAPADPLEATRALQHAIGDGTQRAVLALHGDTLAAYAGTLHADPRALTGPSGIVATPFGLTLYVAQDSAGHRVVAASLLYTASPASRLTRGLAQRLPGDELTEGFDFAPASDALTADATRYRDDGRALFVARPRMTSPDEVRYRILERARVRAGVALLLAFVAFLVAVARREVRGAGVMLGALVVLRCVATAPLSDFSTRSRLFDAAVYFLPAGRAFTANAGALALSASVILLAALLTMRRLGHRLPRPLAVAIATVTIGAGPFIVGALARGIAPPADGAGSALWLIWTIPLCLATTALLVIAGWAGRVALGGRRGLPAALGPVLALGATVVAPLVWNAPGQWPAWYSMLWTLAVGTFVLARPSRHALRHAAMIAGLAATAVVWARTSRMRVELAEHDVRGLAAPDAYAVTLANRLADGVRGDSLPRTAQALLDRYLASDLASSGYPVALTAWDHGCLLASFGSAPFDVPFDTVGMVADAAIAQQRRVVATTRATVYGVRVVAVPMKGGALAILVAPRTRLIGGDAYARWYGLPAAANNEPPYTVQVIDDSIGPRESVRWRRDGTELHGDWPVQAPGGMERAHVEVDLRGLESLLPRGGLLVIADLALVGLVWLLAALADGRVERWLRLRRRRLRSYRARLSVGLFLFFLVPAGAFAIWSWRQLFDDAQASRRLLVTETMRAVSGGGTPDWLRRESVRLDTKLLLYQNDVLVDASDSLFAQLSPMGTLLRPAVASQLGAAEEVSATMTEPLVGATGMMGYRVLPAAVGVGLVLAAPARVDDILLDRRRRDLGVLVLFATALGGVAALWLSGFAARQLARPIGALRAAARAVARGEIEPALDGAAPSEFVPVFNAFRAMETDLRASRSALEEAQRRTTAVLRTVASGVVAVDEARLVILANPRAEQLLGVVPPPGAPIAALAEPTVATRVDAFLVSRQAEDNFELEREGRTLRGQLTRLGRGGVVLTLDDVTDLARAQRVIAWGEMARQVAHEIKNPLTPIRLGVQHLRRAYGRPDFDAILEQNVSRILGEIDRLDEIARAFSRYGGAPEARVAPEPTDLPAIARDVVALETLGEGTIDWSLSVEPDTSSALARGDELREVLLNLFENARLANARRVRVAVRAALLEGDVPAVAIDVTDDGSGIAADVLPRIFEPHFSTRTSGSGLGLAITRRLVESWGGEVTITSELGRGTTVRVALRIADPP